MTWALSRKNNRIPCDLTSFRKIKELLANAVETPLGVTGLLRMRKPLMAMDWLINLSKFTTDKTAL